MVQLLRVRLLGGLEVEGVERPRLGSRKARRLLTALALARGSPVSQDALTDALWPEGPPARPTDQISVLASRLRRVLGADRIRRVAAGYALAADWLDVDALDELVNETRRRLHNGEVAAARSAAKAAAALARGPLLPEEPDAAWLETERAAAERATHRARLLRGESALAAGDGFEAVEPARRALEAEPYDEEALRLLMSAYAATGRPALALTAYAEAAARLADDLGTDPAPETAALHVAILRRQTAPPPDQPAVVPAELPGRSEPLRALDEALRAAVGGRLAFVVAEGEAGIGKTALLDAWGPRARASGATVLRAASDELGGSLPLEPVLAVLDAHVRSLESEDARRLLGAEGEILGALLGGAGGGPGARDLLRLSFAEPGTERAVLFAALEAVVGRLATDAPLVLVLDDAHLADQATAAWLHHCARRLSGRRLMLVAARRPEEGAVYAGTVTLRLGPLDIEAAGEVVGADKARELHPRSGGHPLFLTELARFPGVSLPESVRDSVTRRCERAGPAAATLRAAAVLGTQVDLDLLAHVLTPSAATLLDHLEDGARRRLLTEHRDGFAFAHQLVREALVAGTSRTRRTLLHRDAARVLAARPRPEPLRVAYHARESQDLPLAASALGEAAEIAAYRYDHDEALRLLNEALTVDDTGPLRLRRARARLAASRYGEAADDAGAALAAGEGAEALETAAQAAYFRRDLPKALRLAEDGARLAEAAELRAGCAALAGRVRLSAGALPEAEQWLTQEYVRACEPVRPVADLWLAVLRNQQGDGAAALTLLSGEGVARYARQPFTPLYWHWQRAHALGLLGRPVEALAELDRLEKAIRSQQAERFASRGENVRGWILRNLGAAEEADGCNERAFDHADRLGLSEARSHALLDLADGRLRAGDLDTAADLLDRVDDASAAPQAMLWRQQVRRRLLAGRLILERGAAAEAVEMSLELFHDARRLGLRRYAVLAELLLARARVLAGDPPPPESVADAVTALDQAAPLEAWYLTAGMARDFGVDAWARLAARRASGLVAVAGPWADRLRGAAAPLLDGRRRSRETRRRGPPLQPRSQQ